MHHSSRLQQTLSERAAEGSCAGAWASRTAIEGGCSGRMSGVTLPNP